MSAGDPMCWRNLDERHLQSLLNLGAIPTKGISRLTIRHTCASLINELRASPRDIGVPRHLDKMIDDTYSHVAKALQQSTSDRMAMLLHG